MREDSVTLQVSNPQLRQSLQDIRPLSAVVKKEILAVYISPPSGVILGLSAFLPV